MEFNPKISIVIPVYNGSNYLREAIDSALVQTYKNFEIIVVNDGSNDDGKTEAVAKSYGNKIRYFCKPNGGVSTALNLAIKNMTGDYFSWLSHDDIYVPDKLEYQVRFLRRYFFYVKSRAILYGDYDVINHSGNYLYRCSNQQWPRDHVAGAIMMAKIALNANTMLIHKDCFQKVGLFDETLKITQDCAMWFLLTQYYEFIHISYSLAKWRYHKESDSFSKVTLMQKECENLYVWGFDNFVKKNRESLSKPFSYAQTIWHLRCRKLYKAANNIMHNIPPQLWIYELSKYFGFCLQDMWGTLKNILKKSILCKSSISPLF